ncbi:MAG: F0F1 ATP synthase subunit B' [Alphaproteobacteria bacterium]|jgi:F-type H+-transporting ATPase subunit b|nr:F0F1 ATP synthase subunit B' [Alphaproteobacteria bacterium]
MPQLDLTTFPSQLFWLAVTFYILYRLMSGKVLPRISDVLEERSDRITNDLEQAETLKKQAEDMIQAYEAELAQARSRAQATIGEVRQEVSDYAQRRQQEESARWAENIAEAEERIAKAKTAAQAELRDMVMDVSHDLTVKLTGLVPNRTAMSQAVDSALREQG